MLLMAFLSLTNYMVNYYQTIIIIGLVDTDVAIKLHVSAIRTVYLCFYILIAGQYNSEYEYDNKALGCLLKGVCLRIMNSPLHAEECLKSVISMEKKIKEDRFLVPYAHVELAFVYKAKGNLDKAAYYLETAKYD